MEVLHLNCFQYQFWINSQLASSADTYNAACAFKIEGKLNIEHLKKAIDCILQENPPLHSFIRINEQGNPYWLVQNTYELPFYQKTLPIEILKDNDAINNHIDTLGSICFDLMEEFPCKFYILKFSETSNIIVCVYHHLIIDGKSFFCFNNRLSEIYNSLIQNVPITLNPFDYYSLFIQSTEIVNLQKKNGLNYWRQYLADTPIYTALPDLPGEKEASDSFYETTNDRISKQLIDSFCKKERISHFRLYTSIWSIALYRYFNLDKFILNYTIDLRPEEFNKAVGVFINDLPLKFNLSASYTFREVINQVSKDRKEARNFQNIPLYDILSYARNNSSLFGKQFNLGINYPANERKQQLTLHGCSTSLFHESLNESGFDLLLLIEESESFIFRIIYSNKIVKETVQALSEAFLELLKQAIKNPDSSINQKSLIPTEKIKETLRTGHSVQAPINPSTICDEMAKSIEQHASQCALKYNGQQLSYQQLDIYTWRIANTIRTKFATPNSAFRIGLCTDRNLYMIPTLLGILYAGYTYVPLDPNYPKSRLNFIIKDCEISLVMTQRKHTELIGNQVQQIFIEDIINKNDEATPFEALISPQQIAYIIYTSGTTGVPKGIPIKHYQVTQLSRAEKQIFNINKESNVLQYSNIFFDASITEIFTTLFAGGSLIIATEEERKNTASLTQLIEDNKITCATIPPALLAILPTNDFPSLETIIVGGESTADEVIQRWKQRKRVINAYGPTENTVDTTCCLMDKDSLANDIGLPLPGVVCYVLDKNLNPVPFGALGELYIGGIQLTEGYINRPELNAKAFIRNPFYDCATVPYLYKSGDLVRKMSNGHLLFYGRIDSQVKIRGFRIELEEIQSTINQSKDIIQSLVRVININGNPHLTAYIQSLSDKDDIISNTRKQLIQVLPEYMIPTAWVVLKDFPLTPNGKIDLTALPDPILSLHEETYIPPKTPTEQDLQIIWQELLNIKQVGSNDHFLKLGGDSILLIHMSMLIQQRMKINCPISEIYAHLTLSDLATWIDSHRNQVKAVSSDRSNNLPLPLASPAQLGLWLTCNTSTNATISYNCPLCLEIKGELNIQALEASLAQILDTQEELHLSFIDKNGELLIQQNKAQMEKLIPIQTDQDSIEASLAPFIHTKFDLVNGPLYLFKLFQLTEQHYLLLLNMHHLIIDGWSTHIFLRLLFTYYKQAISIGNDVVTPKTKSSHYIEYAQKANEYLYSTSYKTDLEYWKKELKEVSPLTIEKKYSSVRNDDYQGNGVHFEIPMDLYKKAQTRIKELGITPFVFFFNIYSLLLSKYYQQDNFAIGIPYTGREDNSLNDIIGYFVQTLPIHVTIPNDATVEEQLLITNKKIHEAIAHSRVPLSHIVNAMQTVSTPLFNTMFTLEDKIESFSIGDLQICEYRINFPVSKYDLTLEIQPDKEHCYAFFEYSTSIFDSQTIEQMKSSFLNLLDAITESPRMPIKKLSLLSTNKITELLSNKEIHIPEEQTSILTIFHDIVTLYPDKIALTSTDTEQVTYLQLDHQSNQIAAYLQKTYLRNHGSHLPAGFPIGIRMKRGNAMIAAIFGILKAGGCYVPLDTSIPEQRLSFIIEDCGIDMLLTDDNNGLEFPEEMEEIPQIAADQNAYIIYTSGTTGVPKGIPITYGNLSNLLNNEIALFHINADSICLQYASINFDASVTEIFTALLSGATLIVATEDEYKDASLLVKLLQTQPISHATIPPAILSILPHIELPHLKVLIIGGESTSQSVLSFWKKGRMLFNAYGPTENTVDATVCLMDEETPANDIGLPLKNVNCYVLDKDLNIVPDGAIGELYIGGKQLTRGYLNRPDLTSELFIDNPYISMRERELGINTKLYKSGDLVTRLPNGHLLFRGRTDFQIKINGFRIELSEIENRLRLYPNVNQAVVLVKEKNNEKYLVAYVQAKNTHSITINELKNYLAKYLPAYMQPKTWCIVDTFPINSSGKIDRNNLPEPNYSVASREITHNPITIKEILFTHILSSILQTDKIDVEADLFDLGLTSIQVMSAVFEASKIGLELSVSTIYKQRTIRSILHSEKSNHFFWVNEYQENKPIMLIVCGYLYYNPNYEELAHIMGEHYSIFVFEYFNELFLNKSNCTFENFMLIY
ncbi:amino acid adenylation domain-containing protein, partial [Parabacteroides sp.]